MGGDDKPLRAIKGAWRDFLEFPRELQSGFGVQLRRLQEGRFPREGYKRLATTGAPPLDELYDDDDRGDSTYRVIVVILDTGIYVLHAFKKKSTRGIATPQREINTALMRRQIAITCDTAIKAGDPTPATIETLTRM